MKAEQGHADAILQIKDHQLQIPEDLIELAPAGDRFFSLLTLMIVMEQHFGRLWSNATVIFSLNVFVTHFWGKTKI